MLYVPYTSNLFSGNGVIDSHRSSDEQRIKHKPPVMAVNVRQTQRFLEKFLAIIMS